jgi:inhibitor of cysteine peptidase
MKSFVVKLFAIILSFGLVAVAFAEKDFSRMFKAIHLPKGKIITIPLKSNPASGFSWQLVKISDKMVVEFLRKEYVADSQKAAGSGRIENWIFKTVRSGKAVIVFEYRRQWEKDVPAQNTEEFNIFVE